MESKQLQELKDVTGDVMIGCFHYLSKTALYIVNYDMELAQNIRLEFCADSQIQIVQNAEVSNLYEKELHLDMAAGEGVLLIFE